MGCMLIHLAPNQNVAVYVRTYEYKIYTYIYVLMDVRIYE